MSNDGSGVLEALKAKKPFEGIFLHEIKVESIKSLASKSSILFLAPPVNQGEFNCLLKPRLLYLEGEM